MAVFSEPCATLARQIEAGETQNKLLGEELQGVQSLAAEGYAPQSRVRNLQRDQAEIYGQHGQYRAAIAQAVSQLRLVGVNGPYSVSLSPVNEPEPT